MTILPPHKNNRIKGFPLSFGEFLLFIGLWMWFFQQISWLVCIIYFKYATYINSISWSYFFCTDDSFGLIPIFTKGKVLLFPCTWIGQEGDIEGVAHGVLILRHVQRRFIISSAIGFWPFGVQLYINASLSCYIVGYLDSKHFYFSVMITIS